jgi:hypothetical protein
MTLAVKYRVPPLVDVDGEEVVDVDGVVGPDATTLELPPTSRS